MIVVGGEPDPDLEPEPTTSSSSFVGSRRRLFFFSGVRESFRSRTSGSVSCQLVIASEVKPHAGNEEWQGQPRTLLADGVVTGSRDTSRSRFLESLNSTLMRVGR